MNKIKLLCQLFLLVNILSSCSGLSEAGKVLRNEKIIMRISYETRPFWQGKMIIEHLEREYKLSIQTLQSNQLP